MKRKVSLWIVSVLVGALAATTAATVVLAQRDDGRGDIRADGRVASGWSHPGLEENGEWQGPVMGSLAGWEREGETPILPWVLFAVATGTAVGLLIAWSPWRAQPVTVTVDAPRAGGDVDARAHETQDTAAKEIAVGEIAVNEIADDAAPEEGSPQA